jgi:hypothetical protein
VEDQRTRRALRMARWGLLVLAALLTILVLVLLVLREQTPGWIAGLSRAPGVITQARAEAVERGAWAEFSRVRPMQVRDGLLRSEAWQVSLAAIDAEAWLTHRLDATTQLAATWNLTSAQRIAKDVRAWRVSAADAGPLGPGVLLGMQAASGRWTWLRAEVRDAGRSDAPVVRLVQVGQGNTKVPLGLVARLGLSSDLSRAADVMSDDAFWRVKLPDGREVRLLGAGLVSDAQGGKILLTCETVLEGR